MASLTLSPAFLYFFTLEINISLKNYTFVTNSDFSTCLFLIIMFILHEFSVLSELNSLCLVLYIFKDSI